MPRYALRCTVPGCPEPRKIVDKLCKCEEGGCERQHVPPECCIRHSSNLAGSAKWLRNDGLVDRQAIDIIIHEERPVQVTWVEALIVSATLLAIGYPENESSRRLGFDVDIHRHGPLRGVKQMKDIKRAVAHISGAKVLPAMVELPEGPTPDDVRKQRQRESMRRRYQSRTPEQKARDLELHRAREKARRESFTPEQRAAELVRKAARERERVARKATS